MHKSKARFFGGDVKKIDAQNAPVELYNPYKSPADLTFAERHLTANTVNTGIESSDPKMKCLCCGHNYDVKQYDIGDDADMISNMGVAYPLLFKFIKFLVIVAILVFLTIGLPLIIVSLKGFTCLFVNCEHNPYVEDYNKNYMMIHICSILSVLILIAAKNFFAHRIREYENKVDLQSETPSDFTAYVRGMSKRMSSSEIKEFFSSIDGKEINVVKVNKIYKIDRYINLLTKYLTLEKQLKFLEKENDTESNKYKKLTEEFNDIENQILTLQVDFADKTDSFNKYFTGEVFVIFETDKELFEVLDYYKSNPFLSCFHTGVKVKRACEPSDVLWTNYGLNMCQKLTRRILSLFVAAAFIGICFFVIWQFEELQRNTNKKYDSAYVTLFNIIISSTISIINVLLMMALAVTTEWERRPTFSYHQLSIMGKIYIASFINTSIVLTVLNVVDKRLNMFNNDGIAKTIITILILNAFVSPLLTFFDFSYFFQLFKRWRIRRRIAKGEKVYQCEANEAYEGQVFTIERYYAICLKSITSALFFTPIVPIALPLVIIELVLSYWVWKYILIRRAQMPKYLGFTFCKWIVRYFEFAIAIYTIGFMIFDWAIAKSVTALSITLVVIGIANLFIFNSDISTIFFQKTQNTDPINYHEERKKFANEYDRLNPVTQKKAYIEWLEFLGILKDEDKKPEDNKKDINNILATMYDYISHNNALGKGHDNLYAYNNPFARLNLTNLNTFLNGINYYRLEDEAYIQSENKQGRLYQMENDIPLNANNRYQPLHDMPDQPLPYVNNFYQNFGNALPNNMAVNVPDIGYQGQPYKPFPGNWQANSNGYYGNNQNGMSNFIQNYPHYLTPQGVNANPKDQNQNNESASFEKLFDFDHNDPNNIRVQGSNNNIKTSVVGMDNPLKSQITSRLFK